MKHLLRRLLMAVPLVAALLTPMSAYCDIYSYLTDSRYYDATVTATGKLHITIPFEEQKYSGAGGYAPNGSYLWIRIGNQAATPILYYENNADVRIRVLNGIIDVTNDKYNSRLTIINDGQNHVVKVAPHYYSGGALSSLEFDWFPSEDLLQETFTLGVSADLIFYTVVGDQSTSTFNHTLGTFSNLSGTSVHPQLIDPIFYTPSSTANVGKVAVPYVIFQTPLKYYTSWNSAQIPCQEQSDMLYVQPLDTVQPGFMMYVQVQGREASDTTDVIRWLPSNKVAIPAYHKIHDFTVGSYTYQRAEDSLYYKDNRYKQLTWSFHYPHAEDIVPNDMFEIQRAYQSDFSDAQTIAMMPIEWPDSAMNEKIFTYVDSTRQAWYNPVQHNGNIYYRVRRTSSAVWGWEGHNYACSGYFLDTTTADAHLPNFIGYKYYLDDNFADNHKVYFEFSMRNMNYGGTSSEIPREPRAYWDDRATLYLLKIMQETGDTLRIVIPADSVRAALNRILYDPNYLIFSETDPVIHFSDVANSPCVHYYYQLLLDTTGATLPYDYWNDVGPWDITPLPGSGEPYYTNAGNLEGLEGTHQVSPEYVRLTWGMTDGGVDEFVIEARPDNDPSSDWTTLGTTTNSFWIDREADPEISPVWQYRVTMNYICEGNTVNTSHVTTGSRSPYGRISGRVHYEDGSGCPGITVTATRTDNGATVQVVTTDSTGAYLLDSLPYGGGVEYAITPTSETAQFRYNNTSSASATITLSLHRCITQGVDFDNISSVRFTGRVLFENSSVPVRDACFRLNGTLMRFSNTPVKTDASGNFELRVPQGSAFTLQVVKEGHRFDGDGFVRINNDSLLTLSTPLDGVRVWDQTKVRLTGRVCGGLDQTALPLGLGLSHNNLGNDLKLVLELEGDNVSYVVRVPSDLTKDTLEYTVPHLLYGAFNGVDGFDGVDTVGRTKVHYQLKRVVIEPDLETGEFSADLFPVRWKIIQASATGHATLFSRGRTGEVIDLSGSATVFDTVREAPTAENGWGEHARYATSNANYKLTYRAPITITCKQLKWGMEVDYFGEPSIRRQNITNESIQVPVATKQADGTYRYLFGAPVFESDIYDFRVYAHEDYYYNNDPNGTHDEVRIKGGTLKIYNGMHENESANTQVMSKELDTLGSADFSIPIDYVSFVRSDTNVQRVLDLSVESEGEYVEQQAVRGYVTGHRKTDADAVTSTHGNIQLLDVLRDPPGSNSSAYIESGAEYSYSYTYDFQFKFGLEFGLTLGTQAQTVMGAFVGMGGGTFLGQNMEFHSTYDFSLPITSSYNYKHEGNYTFKTAERISTSSDPYYVGQDADVYIGAVQNVYFRRVDAVQPLDSVTFAALGGSSANGTLQTVGEGVDTNGNKYYLVIGSELETGPYLNATFAYTHSHIRDNLIPQLTHQRDALLLTCDSATAQATADARGTQVYWSRVSPDDENWSGEGYYLPMRPTGSSQIYADEVSNLNSRIADWGKLLFQNEAEKVAAIHQRQHDSVATYSVSGPLTLSRSENYSYSNAYHVYWDYPGFGVGTGDLISNIANAFAKPIVQLIANAYAKVANNSQGNNGVNPLIVGVNAPGSATKFSLTPIIDFNFGRDPERSLSHTREIGFTLAPDEYSNMDVSIYRLKKSTSEFAFNVASDSTREFVDNGNDYDGNSYLYGSLVYYLRGGASKCPCEEADSTEYYSPKTALSAGSLKLENPKVDINVHERSDVPVDRPALFTIQLYNEMEASAGAAMSNPIVFKLKMNEQSNPHGARVYIDGMPLTDGRMIILIGNQVITKTMEVYAGDGYDFEDLVIEFGSTCINTTKGSAQFSVHFMPVSCDVSLDRVHDNWVLNTLSPQDSTGYYLPVGIKDFDVNYRNFDHIEFQYKLSRQSVDSWVTLCSYYHDSALYAAASGTKAMITGGRIDNIHFYGERDPIEMHYDLRAVSFCRHGSGFITKSSEVFSGIKDTRCPRVFGQPEPAYGILGVADNIKLRFNEPIAGNYLDEDNNFQLLGVTNSSGRISTGTSLYFDGTPSCGASSAVTRVLADKSFSIDLMAKPYTPVPSGNMELFGHTTPTGGISFGLTPDGDSCRMYAYINEWQVRSLPMEALTDFRRMVMVVDLDEGRVRFFAGTEELTDPAISADSALSDYLLGLNSQSAPLVFGHGFRGNMLEARVWIKAMSQADIVETHERRLTGYERKLAAYYPMNEGRGTSCADKASGSTLSLHGFAWTTPAGFALHLDGSQAVSLDQNILSRSNIQDYTLMFWFRTTEYNVPLFSAGWRQRGYQGVDGFDGTLIAIENGRLRFRNGNMMQQATGTFADGGWHHYVLTVNRTLNNAAVYVDGNLMNTFATDTLGGLSGDMLLGGAWNRSVLRGSIDELVVFEQALPRSLVEAYDNLSPYGDEMGLVAWLPFSEQVENSNGIMEEHFSINNRKIVRDTTGAVVNKIQPLVLAPGFDTLSTLFATDEDIAPVRERDLLSKINFDWSFNNDELLININMQDREINKNNIYITVRNVEDLNGNRTVSPSMWQVYVNKNTLLWNSEGIYEVFYEQADPVWEIPVQIMNVSGRRHRFTIDGLPDWLSVNQTYGSINPQETQTLHFTIHDYLPVGVFSEIIYLTDENGLSEPLKVFVEIRAICPWGDVDPNEFDRQMSFLGQVMVDGVMDTDPNDVVVAMVDNKIIGRQNITFNNETSATYLFMTIYGNSEICNETVSFRLWQSSTGRIYSLSSSPNVTFTTNGSVGLPPQDPVLLSTSVNEFQYLDLHEGWNWVSLNIKPDNNGAINGLFYSPDSFTPGDQIKSASSQQFAEWDGERWMGSLTNANYRHTFMIYCDEYHLGVQVPGRRFVSNSERTLSLHGGWNSFPYLLNSTQSVTNALADYIENASVGDIVKSQTEFAVFNYDNHWIGSLTALIPGEGYLLFRNDTATVPFVFRNSNAKGHSQSRNHTITQTHNRPMTNMTIIAKVDANPALRTGVLYASVANAPVGVAELQVVGDDSLFFLSVGTDNPGLVSFFIDNDGVQTPLYTASPVLAKADRHLGSLDSPFILTEKLEAFEINAYPTIFDDYVEVFFSSPQSLNQQTSSNDVVTLSLFTASGVKVGTWTTSSETLATGTNSVRIDKLKNLSAGVYFLTVTVSDLSSSIKLIKK